MTLVLTYTPAEVRGSLALRVADAVYAGEQSNCQKSKRGVVIFPPTQVQSTCIGWNHTPPGFRCDGSAACREACGKLCVHAEEHALSRAHSHNLFGFEMLHVKVVDGEAVPSGPPSCWQCSRAICDTNLRKMWLLHESPWGGNYLQAYTTKEFHTLTLQNCGLPVLPSDG